MLVVVGSNIFIGDQHARTKSLIDESKDGQLPLQVSPQLILGKTVFRQRRAELGVR
jgi:hypothetical protein